VSFKDPYLRLVISLSRLQISLVQSEIDATHLLEDINILIKIVVYKTNLQTRYCYTHLPKHKFTGL